ncbi:MAG: hypothetical protein CSB24_04260 [Deltaproteobacteria bacterium]|nr:MAG: hypothetical protein CSB24_04260 [Deltaproteobacteria bacterium]
MSRTLEYQNYKGSIEVDNADFSLSGKILYIDGDYSYQGDTFEELEQNFRKAVDAHMAASGEKDEGIPFL